MHILGDEMMPTKVNITGKTYKQNSSVEVYKLI